MLVEYAVLGCLGVVLLVVAANEIRSTITMIGAYRSRSSRVRGNGLGALASWPRVLVQLPVYRERHVLERLVRSCQRLAYPAGLLEIQIIDDTHGADADAGASFVKSMAAVDERISYVSRPTRTGYKAGALNHGMKGNEAELAAIFDADFVPSEDFLLRTVPAFADPAVAAVQARWSHINVSDTYVTALQGAVFETLFVFEHRRLQSMDLPVIFLGTAGVWRLSVVRELGGWKEFPFTSEDVDLSLRAHACGWKIKYEDAVMAKAELAVGYSAYKKQQRRWARGVLRALLDNWYRVLRSPFGFRPAVMVLSMSLAQISVASLACIVPLLTLAVIAEINRSHVWVAMLSVLPVLLVLSPSATRLVLAHRGVESRRSPMLLVLAAPLLLGVSLGMATGCLQTLSGSAHPFDPTPHGSDAARSPRAPTATQFDVLPELLYAGMCLYLLPLCLSRGYYECMPLLVLFLGGYSWCVATVVIESVKHRLGR